MSTYRQTSHRQLKHRAQKRRVSAHQYKPEHQTDDNKDYFHLREHQIALNKLKREPQLMDKVKKNLRDKQRQHHGIQWQTQLLKWKLLLENCHSIEDFEEKVLECGNSAAELRRHSVLDCLFDTQ
ncbi:MAG: hypothetical protein ACI9FJ_002130 [Alteromonadaceae bacterium]|jgi:hypothetical protein